MSENPHGACPFEDCGSSDAFSYSSDGFGKCHSCSKSYPHKGMQVFDWAKEAYPLKEKRDIKNLEPTTTTYEGIRGIDADVAKLYGIQLQLDADGKPYRYAFKHPNNVKYRGYEKKDFWVKNRGESMIDLFGPPINAGSSKRLYVTEGEFDAASLYQVLGKSYPVMSIPSAGIGEAFLKKTFNFLNSFQEIVYTGELDDPGKAAAEKIYNMMPEKFFYTSMTLHKDANEYLEKGDGTELKWAALKPQRYTPDNFFCSDDDIRKAISEENPYQYVPTGIEGWDYKLRGLVKGGMTFVKAPRGLGKCLHPNQGVLLAGGTSRKAKDIKTGDVLLGLNGEFRNVLSTTTGQEEMFKITPTKGKPWICNRSHILHTYHYEKGIVNLSVDDYLKLTPNQRKRHVQVRSEEISFRTETKLEFDPYLIGLYLGDGSRKNTCIFMGETKTPCVQWLKDWAKNNGYQINEEQGKNCVGYHLSTLPRSASNPFAEFKKTFLMQEGERVIPHLYKSSSVENRKKLLAGILDADGFYGGGCFDIVQKSERLAEGIAFVCRSLGLAAYVKPCKKGVKETGFVGDYFRLNISGDFTDIPFLRHKVVPRQQVKSVLRTGFTVESLGVGEYCGFEIDGDKLFLLDDFTITHNTEIVRMFEAGLLKNDPDVKFGLLHAEEMKSTTYRAMATYQLGVNVRTRDDAKENGISEEEVIVAAQTISDQRAIIFEMRSNDDPMEILNYIRTAATVYGAEYIFIDHIQRLAYLSQAGTDGATSTLTSLGSNIAQMCKELNIGVIVISQVNDDGRTKYAGALEEEAIICVLLERDLESDDPIVQNTTHFKVDKNRPFSKLGEAGSVYYETETTILRETEKVIFNA